MRVKELDWSTALTMATVAIKQQIDKDATTAHKHRRDVENVIRSRQEPIRDLSEIHIREILRLRKKSAVLHLCEQYSEELRRNAKTLSTEKTPPDRLCRSLRSLLLASKYVEIDRVTELAKVIATAYGPKFAASAEEAHANTDDGLYPDKAFVEKLKGAPCENQDVEEMYMEIYSNIPGLNLAPVPGPVPMVDPQIPTDTVFGAPSDKATPSTKNPSPPAPSAPSAQRSQPKANDTLDDLIRRMNDL
ncbi:hypothetical protein GMRT_13505 [Giardia muris]|uniref:Uncharacterized protein n=1 Tax=Giardia muris TaxID=5742 RepID=A0A4Z1SQ63_GIAMU|nr:hypothetical protein GMRT_13505 [Giardia muris]|eukprot:TNJ27982.1 hypothetical protein GMRT_13505 [Giardia muris]